MFCVVLKLNDRYCKVLQDGFESREAAWEWMYSVSDNLYSEYHMSLGEWVVLTDKEWKEAQQIARNQGPWNDTPRSSPLYPWTFFCPDCGSSHGRGKGPYGLGMHYCVNGWTGPSKAPFVPRSRDGRRAGRKETKKCDEMMPGRQCRNGIKPDETKCWKHR